MGQGVSEVAKDRPDKALFPQPACDRRGDHSRERGSSKIPPPPIVIDTSVWVSALLNPQGHPARLIDLWIEDRFDVVTSAALLDELARVLSRPRLQRIRPFSEAEAQFYLIMIQSNARMVPTTGHLKVCRDPTDNELLEAALAGKAEYLVSRDADLIRDLELIRLFSRRGVKIVTVRQLLRRMARKN